MGKISAADVKKLRTQTGAGMMDCKKALTETDGDFEKAIEVLRKKGQKVAAKRADRESTEGVTIARVSDDHKKGIVISLNCETDFVAKNDDFVKLATELADLALQVNTKDELMSSSFGEISVSDKLTEQTGVIGEKLEIGDYRVLNAEYVGHYIHANNKIAVVAGLSKAIDDAAEAAKEVAMQAAAMNPLALNEHEIPKDVVEKEIEIAKDTLRKEGKPEAMLDKIAEGKLKRYFKDNTLVNMAYIKDNKQTLTDFIKSYDKDIEITGFERVSLV
ncbi:MAG: translation elongation factor Ts [Psychroflexus sp.]|jgi:elongation factor Ts|nr:translation elongation factor Ts [Psychroflexus sp.]MDR9448633.1 translation elongation factor Ts [Psychroflexus sp.]